MLGMKLAKCSISSKVEVPQKTRTKWQERFTFDSCQAQSTLKNLILAQPIFNYKHITKSTR
jgi:hypothetical protein